MEYLFFFFVLGTSVQFVKAGLGREVTYKIKEETEPPFLLGELKQELDLASVPLGELRFTMVDGNAGHSDLFTVKESSGQIWTNKNDKIDRDVICPGKDSCEIQFEVMVQPDANFQVVLVNIIIEDINDCSPVFPKPVFNMQISEGVKPGMTFPLPSATDDDSPENGIKQYLFTSQSTQGTFSLQVTRRSNGKFDLRLRPQRSLDREVEDKYQIKIIAEDNAIPPNRGEMIINVTITDVNDNRPKYNRTNYEIEIKESWPLHRPILTLHAYDPDIGINGQVLYSLFDAESDTAAIFRVSSTTGEIFLRKNLNYEDGNLYEFGVMASNQFPVGLFDTAMVTVKIKDVNNHAPAISIGSTRTGHIVTVRENAKETKNIAFVRVSDADRGVNGEFSCSVSSREFQLRQFKKGLYGIRAKAQLDRERASVHNITVNCFDHGNPSRASSAVININIADENDNAPQFTGHSYSASIKENNIIDASVIRVQARDADAGENGRIMYELLNKFDVLSINRNSGLVTAKAVFDFEQEKQMEFIVVARDCGVPVRSSSATVTLQVIDANDVPPKFAEPNYKFETPENGAAGDEVGQVSATDGDARPYNVVMFSIDTFNSPFDTFAIEPSTGRIRTKKALDREFKELYNLIVIATDTGSPPLSSSVSVVVYVKDKNDNVPIIDYPNPYNETVLVSSSIPAGYRITKVLAHDIDNEENAKLSYHLSRELEETYFGIEQWTGLIYLRSALDVTGRQEEFHGRVIVKDNGSPSLKADTSIRIIFDRTIVFKPEGIRVRPTEPPPILSGPNLWILVAIGSMAGVVICGLIVVLLCLRRKTPVPMSNYKYWSPIPPMAPRGQPHPEVERVATATRPPSLSDSSSLNRRRDNFAVVLQQSILSSATDSTQQVGTISNILSKFLLFVFRKAIIALEMY